MERSVTTSPPISVEALLKLAEFQRDLKTIRISSGNVTRAVFAYDPEQWLTAGLITEKSVSECSRHIAATIEVELEQLPEGPHSVSVMFQAEKTNLRTRTYQVHVHCMAGFDDEVPLPPPTPMPTSAAKLAEVDAMAALPGLQAMYAGLGRLIGVVDQIVYQQIRGAQLQQLQNDRLQAALAAAQSKNLEMMELIITTATAQQSPGPSKEVVELGRELMGEFRGLFGAGTKVPQNVQDAIRKKLSDPKALERLANPETAAQVVAMMEAL